MAGVAPDVVISRLLDSESSTEDFFTFLRLKHPRAIRTIFSEKSNKSSLMKLVFSGMAHRYLCLPWDEHQNTQVLTRDLLTRSRLKNSACWKFLESGGSLPSLPPVVQGIEKILADPDCSVDQIVVELEKDPAIASKLLRVVNSAAFFHGNRINTLHHAVTYMGFNNLREIVLYVSVAESFVLPRQCINNIERLSKHSSRCAKMTAIVAQTIAPDQKREATTGALLHDIGKLLFFSTHCGVYNDITTDSYMLCPSSEIEKEYFGISHDELGGTLMLWWNLPFDIVEAVANHTMPLLDLWGVPLCIAAADRCLIEAESVDELITDLDDIRDKYPVDQWREAAKELVVSEADKN